MQTATLHYADAYVAACAGEVAGPRRVLVRLADECAKFGDVQTRLDGLHLLARLGEAQVAATHLAEIDAGQSPGWQAYAAHVAGLAAPGGDQLFLAAQEYERLGMNHLAAEAYDQAAAHLVPARRSALAMTSRDRCLARCEGVALPWWPMRRTHRLTAREQETAMLAAQGLSNREIADRLVVAVRTVENHLQNAYAKLGVTSRGELADVLQQRNVDDESTGRAETSRPT